ncbi:hypothetical protein [Streptomyces sp. NPDC056244]
MSTRRALGDSRGEDRVRHNLAVARAQVPEIVAQLDGTPVPPPM